MKKVLSLILAIAMMLSLASTVGAVKFADVDENYEWAQDAIKTLSEEDVITGYDDGTFKPGKSITRQEAITLFSKALGASAESNKSIVDFAYGIYESDLEKCADSYAVKQGAFLVYKNIISVDEVVDYLSKANRNLELKRYEAAGLISKALGADNWFEKNPNEDTSVTYSDIDDIPAKYLKYVFYAGKVGIMGGMGDNKFGPNKKVTRAQVAVMIKRIADAMEFSYAKGLITSIDTLNNNIVVKAATGEILKFVVNNSDVIYLDAIRVTLAELEVGMEVSLTFSKDEIYEIDAVSHSGDAVVSGSYKGQLTDNSGTTIKILDTKSSNQTVSSYKLASNAVIIYQGETLEDLSKVKIGDYVKAEVSGGLVVRFIVEAMETTISGLKITEIDGKNTEGVLITTLNKNNEEVKYVVSDEVAVLKNSVAAKISDIAVGDTVAITLKYGVVSVIKATGISKTLEGSIEEITISNNVSYITIAKDNTKTKYVLDRTCAITLEGKEATIYDLRLGSYVKLKTNSETVVSISAEAVESALSVQGTIKTINSAYGLVVIEVQTASGNIAEKQLFIKDSTKILDASTGKSLNIKNLEEGDVITAAGVEKLGVYEVSAIMVLH